MRTIPFICHVDARAGWSSFSIARIGEDFGKEEPHITDGSYVAATAVLPMKR